jgi:hypothetical protein
MYETVDSVGKQTKSPSGPVHTEINTIDGSLDLKDLQMLCISKRETPKQASSTSCAHIIQQ